MTSDNKPKIQELPPINNSGLPTTYMSYRLLKEMFGNHNRSYTIQELSDLTSFRISEVELMCKQLKALDFLTEESSDPTKFKYNVRCKNIELQIGFENFLADVFLKNLQVQIMLDYSPSYRIRHIPWFYLR